MRTFRNIAAAAAMLAAHLASATSLGIEAGTREDKPALRQTINFNREWKFELGDHGGAEAPGYDDRSWSWVGLPHSFSIPYFLSDRFYTGYGWYRKRFAAPADWSGKSVAIEFDAAFQDAEVFLNGHRVGEHRGGYTGFSFDLTKLLQPGDNVLSVRLNNLWKADLAPRAGEHVFSGGLYRDVRLVVTAPLHVAWYGTYVTTPAVSAAAATVAMKTEVINRSAEDRLAQVTSRIVDATGRVVAQTSSEQTIPAGQTRVFDQTAPPVAHPALWHPGHPHLYRLLTTVSEGGKPVDDYQTEFGIRTFRFTAEGGFFINGEHLYLHGADVHQDHAGWGDAVTDAGLARDVKMIKDAGFNWIRGSHYPHAPAFTQACDEEGILYWSENPFWGIGGHGMEGTWSASAYPPDPKDARGFEESVLQELTEMIRIHRNHPSIMAWSVSNEPFFTDPSTMDRMPELLKKEVALAHELDPSRLAGIGGCQRPLGNKRIDHLGDIAGYNGDGAELADFQNPGIPSIVCEYGSTSAVRPGAYAPGWGSTLRLDSQGLPIEYPWRSGQAIWCGFDHGSIAGTRLGSTGIVDYFRLPKRAYYWYRNLYAGVPPPAWAQEGTPAGLALSANQSAISVDGTDDAQIVVSILDAAGKPLSNAVPVTLEIVSGPGEFPTGKSIRFEPNSDIAIRDGLAAIEFRSYFAGQTTIRATSPGLKETSLVIACTGGPQYVKGATPETPDRPYIRFTGTSKATGSAAAVSASLALNRPTDASSSAPGFSPASADDGSGATFWKAGDASPRTWWQVFLENSYQISRVQVAFPGPGAYRFQVQTSPNGQTWATVVDEAQTSDTDAVRTFAGRFGNDVSYLRIQFCGLPPGQPAALAEVTVAGGKDLPFHPDQLGGRIVGTPGSWQGNPATAREAALDGDPATYFDAAVPNGAWVGLDLGCPATLSRILFRPRKDLGQRMTSGRFQAANRADFSDAIDLATIRNAPGDSQATELICKATRTFRYVRYLAPDGSNGNVAEIEFYGRLSNRPAY